METERIALSQRERDRLRVLHEVKRKQITQIEAARRLKISDRHIRRLLVGLRKLGDRAVLHGLRGRPSNRRLAARFEQQIVMRVRQRRMHHPLPGKWFWAQFSCPCVKEQGRAGRHLIGGDVLG
jgi:hypothetical protein